jgi:tRNA modification GTPase
VTLAGRPNVGKSSLMNRLLEEDRAIVTPVAGTTRDTIEESVDIEGLKIRLVDTAGICESHDPVEVEGTRRSVQAIDEADLVLMTVDGSKDPCAEDAGVLAAIGSRCRLLVLNKLDLGIRPAWETWDETAPRCRVCALSGEGLETLRRKIHEMLLANTPEGVVLITHERHVMALERAREALRRVRESLDRNMPGEVAAMDLRDGLSAVGEIIGETTPEDILNRIFESFCIGK